MADVPSTRAQLREQFDFTDEEMILISAKEGTNVDKVLDAIITRIKPPTGQI